MSSQSKKPVSPRISMIAAIGSDGTVFLSLTQVNTDGDIMCTYFTELVKQLDAYDREWRNNSCWLLDNAKWHTSA